MQSEICRKRGDEKEGRGERGRSERIELTSSFVLVDVRSEIAAVKARYMDGVNDKLALKVEAVRSRKETSRGQGGRKRVESKGEENASRAGYAQNGVRRLSQPGSKTKLVAEGA